MAANKNVQVGTSNDTKTLVTVLLLIFVFPIGFILMWVWAKWKLWVKIIVSLPTLLLFLGFIIMIAAVFSSVDPKTSVLKAQCVQLCTTTDTACMTDCMDKGALTKGLPEKLKSNFSTSCLNSGGTKIQCTCLVNYFDQKMSYSEFLEMEKQTTSTKGVTQATMDANTACKIGKK
jgi:hypothetical protein